MDVRVRGFHRKFLHKPASINFVVEKFVWRILLAKKKYIVMQPMAGGIHGGPGAVGSRNGGAVGSDRGVRGFRGQWTRDASDASVGCQRI